MKNFPQMLLASLLCLTAAGPILLGQSRGEQEQAAVAQPAPAAPNFGEPIKQTWRFGVEIKAGAGNCIGIAATAPIPIQWDEQAINILEEEKSDNVSRISFRNLDDGVRQMVVTVPKLAAGESVRAVLVVQVEKRHTLLPTETAGLKIPTSAQSKKLRKFLSPSPYIESTDKRITELAQQIGDDNDDAWTQVRAVFDWVKENVEYKFDTQIKSCLTALDDGVGDCEEMSSLFIAICRAKGIPARAVWVPGHTYPEFYLVDAAGNGYWYPCQVAGGDNDFGRMPEDRPILQRGDNLRVPGMKEPLRYVQPTLTAKSADANPELKWILEKVE